MSEMDKAREIQKVLAQGQYVIENTVGRNGYYSVLIDKRGVCEEYIRVNGTAYMGSNQVLNLDFPTPDNVYFQ